MKDRGELWLATVLQLDAKRCKIHFQGWSKTYDSWILRNLTLPAAVSST